MTKLSVNVNKLATLRNSRGKNLPDVTAMAERILRFGAHGITVHPRPDGRHIRRDDVFVLKAMIDRWNQTSGTAKVEFNVEGFPSDDFLLLIDQTRPDQCTLVPDPPEALTSNAGWDVVSRETELRTVLVSLKKMNVRASVFVDPADASQAFVSALGRLKPDRIELYTESYADDFGTDRGAATLKKYQFAAAQARDLDIGINAGHDLNQANLSTLVQAIPWMQEVSIGHALICEALEQGLSTTIQNYLSILKAI